MKAGFFPRSLFFTIIAIASGTCFPQSMEPRRLLDRKPGEASPLAAIDDLQISLGPACPSGSIDRGNWILLRNVDRDRRVLANIAMTSSPQNWRYIDASGITQSVGSPSFFREMLFPGEERRIGCTQEANSGELNPVALAYAIAGAEYPAPTVPPLPELDARGFIRFYLIPSSTLTPAMCETNQVPRAIKQVYNNHPTRSIVVSIRGVVGSPPVVQYELPPKRNLLVGCDTTKATVENAKYSE